MARTPADTGKKDERSTSSKNRDISTDDVHPKSLPTAFDVEPDDDVKPGPGVSAQELQFVRRVTELLPILSPAQVDALRERIANGYYGNPEVTRIIAHRLRDIFGTD